MILDCGGGYNGLATALFKTVHAGIVVVCANTKKIIAINPAACVMIGVQSEDVVGKECGEYLCTEDCDGCPVMTASIEDGIEDVDNKEIVIYRKDGSKVYALLTVSSIILDDKRMFINSLTDITRLKESEKKLEEFWQQAEKILSENVIHLENGIT
ncbi:hypothetical protein LCGC14_1252750 [marine sediment metagenome]|uniref:PAS domain-containing protein n=1 Tax=marine sediment metagenome TaxID=412755 RepID=A0A0F9LP77_9ZZZZ